MQRYIIVFALFISSLTLSAQTHSYAKCRTYTNAHPLIYEDSWDRYPYSFLNEKGEPAGFTLDVIKMVLEQCNIPYVIKLKRTQNALQDLKDGKADLTFGMYEDLNKKYGVFSNVSFAFFTHSVIYPKGGRHINSFYDLAYQKVIVHKYSISEQEMIHNGWGKNALSHNDMIESICTLSNKNKGQVLWNTMALKWIKNKYHLNNLIIAPINDMPISEYRFLSNDTILLNKIDMVINRMKANDRIQKISNKWFYPEIKESTLPDYIWYIPEALGLIVFGILMLNRIYHIKENKANGLIKRQNARLSLALQAGNITMWIYSVKKHNIHLFDTLGKASKTVPFDNLKIYYPSDYKKIRLALSRIEKKKEKKVMLNVSGTPSVEENTLHKFKLNLSVLRYKLGEPYLILGVQCDITDEYEQEIRTREFLARYRTIFNVSDVDFVFYNSTGKLTEINDKACELFGLKRRNELTTKNIHINDIHPNIKIAETKGTFFGDTLYKNKYVESILNPIFDSNGNLLGIHGCGMNITENVNSIRNIKHGLKELEKTTRNIKEYIKKTSYALNRSDIHLMRYNPKNKIIDLSIFSEEDKHEVSPFKWLRLLEDKSQKEAVNILGELDEGNKTEREILFKTKMLDDKHRNRYYMINICPILDDKGNLLYYFGLWREFTDLYYSQQQLTEETNKAKEADIVKNSFLENMSYEIRTPLNAVVGFAELFNSTEHTEEEEQTFINEIKINSDKLLKLINDILYLSRLDARMIDIKEQEVDFTTLFDTVCDTSWNQKEITKIKFKTINPYNKLTIKTDPTCMETLVTYLINNAIDTTVKGTILIRYEYIGNMISINVDDTGYKIDNKGLNFSICKQLTEQMKGNITLTYEEGKGSSVWVGIPCELIEMNKRQNLYKDEI